MRLEVCNDNHSPDNLIGQPAVASEKQLQNTLSLSNYGPATKLLQQIHSEHLYSSTIINYRNKTSENRHLNEEAFSDEASDFEDDLLSLTIPVSFASKGNGSDRQGIPGDMFNLNADSIQRHFQSMIDMTLLAPLPDTETPRRRSPRINKVTFVENLPGSSEPNKHDSVKNTSDIVNQDQPDANDTKLNTNPDSPANNSKDTKRKQKRSSTKTKRSTTKEVSKEGRVPVNDKEWKSRSKAMDLERELTAYLKHAEELLLKKWTEYLTMTSEELQRFEIKNAENTGMVEEVIDMLKDNDRYVWQLIDELVYF